MMSRYNVSIIDAIPGMVASRFIGPPQPAAEILPRTDHEGASFLYRMDGQDDHGFTAGERSERPKRSDMITNYEKSDENRLFGMFYLHVFLHYST